MLTAAAPVRPQLVAPVDDDEWFSRWRARELSRVEREGLTYLDYTGAALYPESLVQHDAERLLGAVRGNPHSESTPSRDATADLDEARAAILAFLHADPGEYAVVLTPNATGACRIVGESFPFGPDAPLMLTADNHNSVNGIREYARRAGAAVQVAPLDDELRASGVDEMLPHARGGLFAFPAQSNFSGVRHPLKWIDVARARGARTLLDAASYLATSDLDLAIHHPDFVVLSIYKIAGYPTGIGALVARHEALDELQRPWFAGGTVDWVTVTSSRKQLRAGAERFEDGTPPFLAAGAVRSALAAVTYADRTRLARHISELTAELLDSLQSLRHRNGAPLVTIHGPRDNRARGGTVAITLRGVRGDVIPFWIVEEAARDAQIALRGGCFCNPGCAEHAFGLQQSDACLDSLARDFSIPKFAACLGGKPVGAIRISLGLGSMRADIQRVIQFLGGYRR